MSYKAVTIAAAKRRVDKGVALLDEKVPGWWENIDLDRLQLSDATECVLGQLFAEPQKVPAWQSHGFGSLRTAKNNWSGYWGDPEALVCEANYNLGCKVLGLSDSVAADHGFVTPGGTAITYTLLDRVWIAAIASRQGSTT